MVLKMPVQFPGIVAENFRQIGITEMAGLDAGISCENLPEKIARALLQRRHGSRVAENGQALVLGEGMGGKSGGEGLEKHFSGRG
jgi:hypothetical protein